MDVKSVMDNVSERIKQTANVSVVFGEPVVTGNITIIPVATVKLAGGGGGGTGQKGKENAAAQLDGEDSHKDGKGMGMGLRLTTSPVGYIEIRDGKATMVDIVDKNKLAVGGLVIGGLILMTFAKVFAKKLKNR
jgi:uncharacterized spore protein YtfJ